MTDKDRQKRLDAAQLKVLFQVPFFAPGLARLGTVWCDDNEVPTACTDGKVIMWGRKFFDSLKDQELVTINCHEVMHPEFGHLWRMPVGADPELWNEACDHAINNRLKEFSEVVMSKRLADPFPFPDGKYCCDPKFKDMSEEQIYAILAQQKGKGGGGAGKGKGKGRPNAFGEFVVNPGTPDQQKQDKVSWEHTLVQSTMLAKGRGDLPGNFARIIEDFVNPQVPWYETLRHWLRELCTDDYNWMKPNRNFSDCEFILPVLESEKVGPVVFATDTSGSIDHEMLKQFQSEKQSCLDEVRPSKVLDIYCDTRINHEAEYVPGDTIKLHAPAGGGTDFRPVFDRLEKLDEPPKAVVYLTDLDGVFPQEEPPFPVIWVTWSQHGKAPFGEVIYAPQA